MDDKRLIAFGRLLDVMDELREKCPWDRKQTMESLRNNTIEETFELTDAISLGDMEGVREELGDLMLHLVFYSKIGSESGDFDIADVLNGISDKLTFRHPHVFGDAQADTPDQVMQSWERLKLREKRERNKLPGVLSGVPRSLPAMVKAFRIGEKAASVGFDWKQREDVWSKVDEERAEVEAELACGSQDGLEAEFGDLLFAIINAARLYNVDPELALERTNRKFISRFGYMEQECDRGGISITDLSLAQMEEYWRQAKSLEVK